MITKSDFKVSVITPAYNAEKYIVETIESILNQTFKDFEYIIVDDCSTDSTWKIIQEYAKKDSRINAVKNPKNLNMAGNRSKGISLAKSEYIVWQDADDISMPTRIQELYDFMETHPKVGICGSYLEIFNDKGRSEVRAYFPDDKSLRENIFRHSPVSHGASIIRSECYQEVGSYNLEYQPTDDYDMSFRIGKKYEFANIPKVLFRYREHSDSATSKRLKLSLLNTIKIRNIYAFGHGYKYNLIDRLANICTYMMIYLPRGSVDRLFAFLRKMNMLQVKIKRLLSS